MTAREEAIIARVRAGETYAVVGWSYGITRQRVEQIVACFAPEIQAARRAARSAAAVARRVCPTCGKGKSPQAQECQACAAATAASGVRQFWTREDLIERLHAWVETYGETPAAHDWNPAMATALGHPEAAERFYRDGCWPHTGTVQERFGSWNAGLEAAGLPIRPPGYKRGDRVPTEAEGAAA